MGRFALLAGVCALLGACASPAPQDTRADPRAGLIFGAFDLTGSDIAVTHVVLVRVSPTKVYMGGSGERTTVTYENGEFYSPNLSPGTYSLTSFYSGNKPFTLEGGLRQHTIRVEAGGVAYAGIFKLRYAKTGVFQRDDASFERITTRDSEITMLRWLTKELAATDWAPRLRARLAEVEKRPR